MFGITGDPMRIAKCRDFTRERDYAAFSVVRVFNLKLSELGGRGAWVTISGGKESQYRRIMGSGGTDLSQDAIEIDYDSRVELGIVGRPDGNGYYPCELTLSKSSLGERISAHWSHPNLAYRVPYQLAVLSLALGLVGFFLGIVSLIK
jgi:hypothetical protein